MVLQDKVIKSLQAEVLELKQKLQPSQCNVACQTDTPQLAEGATQASFIVAEAGTQADLRPSLNASTTQTEEYQAHGGNRHVDADKKRSRTSGACCTSPRSDLLWGRGMCGSMQAAV